MGTAAQAVAAALSQIGVPYVFGGESPKGSPTPGFDCSGLMQWACAQAEVGIPRTSEAQWAALPHVEIPANGDLVFFDVPSDDQPQPAHVGMVIGPGQMVNAPHTGANVGLAGYPFPGATVIGFGHPAYTPAAVPVPTPSPEPVPLPSVKGVTMLTTDPTSGGWWIVGSDGHVEAYGGAPYLGGLNNHPQWDTSSIGTVAGIAAAKDPTGAWGYVISLLLPAANPAGEWYANYQFPRSGSLA